LTEKLFTSFADMDILPDQIPQTGKYPFTDTLGDKAQSDRLHGHGLQCGACIPIGLLTVDLIGIRRTGVGLKALIECFVNSGQFRY